MDIADSSMLVMIASTVALFVASGVVPFVNSEVAIVVLGTVAPRPLLPLLLAVATLSHMAGKSLMYLAGRSADRWPFPWLQRRVAAARARMAGHTTLGASILFVSASVGVPPFYLVTVTSGVMRYDFVRFFLIGFAGRLLRFGALLMLPQVAAVLVPGTAAP